MVVIADDITGAAEIAGIAFSCGQEVRLLIGCPVDSNGVATKATTVIATDTRSMTEGEAIKETFSITSTLNQHFSLHLPPSTLHPPPSTLNSPPSSLHQKPILFKKTDSVLRGHVIAELTALMQATGYRRAVYLPANPSKGRIIRNGIYYIREGGSEKRLAETAFSYDPEFPAYTSSLRKRFPDAVEKGIIMPDAENENDIDRIVAQYNDGETLFAGAADLFSRLILPPPSTLNPPPSTLNPQPSTLTPPPSTLHPQRSTLHPQPSTLTPQPSTLFVCGSTQSRPDAFGQPVSPMPLAIYDGSDDLTPWLDDALPKYAAGSLVLSIPHHHLTGKAVAVRLRRLTATLVARLFQHHHPAHLCIEGGATAFAILNALNIGSMQVIAQPAPGVVSLQADNGLIITLKPGSYPWGKNPFPFSCSFQK